MAPHLASMHENLDSIPRIRKQEKQKIMGRKEKKEEEEKQELEKKKKVGEREEEGERQGKEQSSIKVLSSGSSIFT